MNDKKHEPQPISPVLQPIADPLADLRAAICRLADELPLADPLPEEMKQLAGLLFPGDLGVVYKVGEAVLAHRELFPGHLDRAQDMLKRQRRALSLETTEFLLSRLLLRVRVQRIRDQSQANRDALFIIDMVDREEKVWKDGLTPAQRVDPDFFLAEIAPRIRRKSALAARLIYVKHLLGCRPRKLRGLRLAGAGKRRKNPFLQARADQEIRARYEADLAEERRTKR